MAAKALAILSGLVFGFGGFREGIVTISAEGCSELLQHLRIGISMGIVAGGAFAVLGGLMFGLCFFEEIVVAAEANLPLIASHFHRESRLMALVALLVFVRRVCVEVRFWSRENGTLGGLGPIERAPVFVVNDCGGVSLRARRWNAIKEEIEPLLLGLR